MDITPDTPAPVANYAAAAATTAAGVQSRLLCQALWFAEGGLALAVLDLGWHMCPQWEQELRRAIRDRAGLGPDQLIVHLVHTHSGPSLNPEDWSNPEWLAALPDRVAEAIEQARQSAAPSELTWKTAHCPVAVYREHVHQGQWVIGGGIDQPLPNEVVVGLIASQGRRRAAIVHYACHPTSLHWDLADLSADYPSWTRETVAASLGGPCIFLQGCSADLGPWQPFSSDPEMPRRLGEAVGGSAVAAALSQPPQSQAAERVVSSGADLLISRAAPPPPADRGAFSQIIEAPARLKPAPMPEPEADEPSRKRNRRRALLRDGLPGDAIPLWVWQIGRAVIIGLPGEAPISLQHSLRAAFPHRTILPLNVANGWLGYFMESDADPRRYTVRTTQYEPGVLESIRDALVKAIQ